MSKVKAPLSLRSLRDSLPSRLSGDTPSAKALGVAAILASSVSASVLAQTASTVLPPVKVDAPREKPHPIAPLKPKPTLAVAAKPHRAPRVAGHASGVRQGGASAATAAATGGSGSGTPTVAAADADPYADPAAPYKVDRLSSNKFTEPVLNTPRTVKRSSGQPAFDEAALVMMKRADPVPAPPPALADEGLSFEVPVMFRADRK